MSTPPPVVGIIGGMGPAATVDLMRRLVERTPAMDDADHLHVIVESNPKIPSRIAHLIEGTGEDPTPELVRIAHNLERAGATLLAMPCNTAHFYAPAIQAAVQVPLLNMVQLTATRLATDFPAATVGLLSSTAVHRTGVYHQALAAHGLSLLLPDDQGDVMDIIRQVKRGDSGEQVRSRFRAVALALREHCDVLLVACTELSVIADALLGAMPDSSAVVDSQEVLVDAILDAALPKEP
jgi:aspartate racemase